MRTDASTFIFSSSVGFTVRGPRNELALLQAGLRERGGHTIPSAAQVRHVLRPMWSQWHLLAASLLGVVASAQETRAHVVLTLPVAKGRWLVAGG